MYSRVQLRQVLRQHETAPEMSADDLLRKAALICNRTFAHPSLLQMSQPQHYRGMNKWSRNRIGGLESDSQRMSAAIRRRQTTLLQYQGPDFFCEVRDGTAMPIAETHMWGLGRRTSAGFMLDSRVVTKAITRVSQ